MDILIKNMEMPKGDEDVKIIINADGSVYRIIGWAISEKKTNAKAIELPPHGRLGDLDKVADDISSRSEKARTNDDRDIADGFMYSAMIVRNAPTVLEANNGSDN